MLYTSFRGCHPAGSQAHRGPPLSWRRPFRVNAASEPAGSDDVADKPKAPNGPDTSPKKAPKNPVFSHALNENFAAEELIDELKDREGFGKRGEVVVLAQLVVAFLVMFPPMQLQGLVYMCGALSLIFGAISTVLSFLGLGRSFSPLVTPRRNNSIITTGMYQYMRHPLYAGMIWLAFGLSAVTYSETRFVLSCLLFFILNYKAGKEEEAMLEQHGEAYSSYMQQLQRFVPKL